MKIAMMFLLFLSFAVAGFGIGLELSKKTPTTNGDRLRAMSDAELAKFLMEAHDCCLHIPFCQDKAECMEALPDIPEERCQACMMEWIKRRAD